jgi:hypothetical protein
MLVRAESYLLGSKCKGDCRRSLPEPTVNILASRFEKKTWCKPVTTLVECKGNLLISNLISGGHGGAPEPQYGASTTKSRRTAVVVSARQQPSGTACALRAVVVRVLLRRVGGQKLKMGMDALAFRGRACIFRDSVSI